MSAFLEDVKTAHFCIQTGIKILKQKFKVLKIIFINVKLNKENYGVIKFAVDFLLLLLNSSAYVLWDDRG